jgi:hypothetical protein
MTERDGIWYWGYQGGCGVCGRTRAFEFRAPMEPLPNYPSFGGSRPSELLDAGEFLEVATLAARGVHADPDDLALEEIDEGYELIAIAVAALEEVLKFVPPGKTSIPRTALWAASSLVSYDAHPEQFARRPLMRVLGAYRQVLAAYSRVVG